METFFALLALCAGISLVTGEFSYKGQWRGVLMFSLICALKKRLFKQSWGRWFETPSRWLWRHCNGIGVVSWLTLVHKPPQAIFHMNQLTLITENVIKRFPHVIWFEYDLNADQAYVFSPTWTTCMSGSSNLCFIWININCHSPVWILILMENIYIDILGIGLL